MSGVEVLPVFVRLTKAAALLDMPRKTLEKLCKAKEGPPLYLFKRGGEFRVRRDELIAWYNSKRYPPQE